MDGFPQNGANSSKLRTGAAFSLERLLSHIDPGTAEESEDFVRQIYAQRRADVSTSDRNETGS